MSNPIMNVFSRSKTAVVGAVTGTMALVSTSANAAVDAGFQTAIDALSADVLLYIAAVTTVGLAILAVALTWDVGFSLIKKYTKKGAK